jgi:predicted DCC family thiol-disulfide oxidoreductase YuxK
MCSSLSSAEAARLLVLYDGECRLCRCFAQWCERRDRVSRLDLVAYQECPRPPMTDALYEACQRAVHVISPNGEVQRGGKAVIGVFAALGWPVAWLRWPPFSWAVEAGYWFVAGHRGRLGWLCRPRNGPRAVGPEPCGTARDR